MGGLWEFPGGKLEAQETTLEALRREFNEELGVTVSSALPLIRIHHDYPDKRVLLDVWRVTDWSGRPVGREGQRVEWVTPHVLHQLNFPDANRPIIQAIGLPDAYPIIDASLGGPDVLMQHFEACLEAGYRMLQLRAKSWSAETFAPFVEKALDCARAHDARVLLNSDIETAKQLGANGVHLSGEALMSLDQQVDFAGLLVGASCHDLAQLHQVERIGAHFAVLSPVKETRSHPGAPAMGWETFGKLVDRVNLPVYALGGLGLDDLEQARACGAQGLAGIRLFTNS